ncbi:hypothetical protein Y032_0003g1313 [Ancylostoma ceylanicum]|uniref:Uncharacterized protein n=1 Tax=Ancylostoma ceylanicum TaxID=53326 RepID=A0A016VX76_9BILA|nr:hypothetical protein Y032_0003g1313 [Ancylostoma ceylanicum]
MVLHTLCDKKWGAESRKPVAHRSNKGESPCGDGRRPPVMDLSNFQEIVGSTWVNIDSDLPKGSPGFFLYNVKYNFLYNVKSGSPALAGRTDW